MNKRKIIIILILMLAVLAGGFWTWKSGQEKKAEVGQWENQQAENQKQALNQQVEIDTSDWKTYRDEKYGFEIRYNPAWEIVDVGAVAASGGETLFVDVDKSRNDIGMYVNRQESELSPKEWLLKDKILGSDFITKKEILINNYPAYYLKTDNDKVHLIHQYSISDNKQLINFLFQEKYKKVDAKTGEIMEASFSQYLPDFEAMVNSIKFLD